MGDETGNYNWGRKWGEKKKKPWIFNSMYWTQSWLLRSRSHPANLLSCSMPSPAPRMAKGALGTWRGCRQLWFKYLLKGPSVSSGLLEQRGWELALGSWQAGSVLSAKAVVGPGGRSRLSERLCGSLLPTSPHCLVPTAVLEKGHQWGRRGWQT